MALTPKQQRFVEEYLVDLNATQAAIRAGYELGAVPPQSGCYVYLLLDGCRICYVGKGTRGRMFQHARDSAAGRISGLKKHQHLTAMRAAGRSVRAVVWASGLGGPAALRLERSLIAALGRENLTNSASGSTSSTDITLVQVDDLICRTKTYDDWIRGFAAKRGRAPSELEGDIAKGILPALLGIRAGLLAGNEQWPS